MYTYYSIIKLTNCTFSENTATSGGGMYIDHGSPTVTNCTFSGNMATTSGGGMYISANSSATVTNTIFLGANDVTGQVVYKGGKPTITYSVVDTTLFTDPTNTAADPKLEPLADNGGPTKTCALLEGSSAIDKGLGVGTYKIDGVDIEVPTTDQRGAKRPQPAGGTVDIGAYEFEVGTLTVTINPEKARTEGAKWSHDGATWHYSKESVHLVPGDYTVTFETITGWTEPASLNVTVIGGGVDRRRWRVHPRPDAYAHTWTCAETYTSACANSHTRAQSNSRAAAARRSTRGG